MAPVERIALASALAVALAGCTPGPDNAVLCNALRTGSNAVEVIVDGRVTRLLGVSTGASGPHEGFELRIEHPCAANVRVESNVGFTGTIPLRVGATVEVKGEFDDDPDGGVIHFTHRELHGRHPGGYVKVGDTYYW